MVASPRTSRPLVTYAGAVCMAFLGTWGVTALEARRRAPMPRATAASLRAATSDREVVRGQAGASAAPAAHPPVIVAADEPAPSRDSLAALLVSSPRVRRAPRGETELLRDVIAVAEQIPSWTERAAVLAEIARLPRLDSSIVSAVGRSTATVLPSSVRGDVLSTLLQRHPHAVGASRRAVLGAIGSMSSSSDRASMLELFVTRPHLSQPALADALAHAMHLSSTRDRSSVLVAAARANRIEGRARTIYVRAAAGLPMGHQRSRALAAIASRSRSHQD